MRVLYRSSFLLAALVGVCVWTARPNQAQVPMEGTATVNGTTTVTTTGKFDPKAGKMSKGLSLAGSKAYFPKAVEDMSISTSLGGERPPSTAGGTGVTTGKMMSPDELLQMQGLFDDIKAITGNAKLTVAQKDAAFTTAATIRTFPGVDLNGKDRFPQENKGTQVLVTNNTTATRNLGAKGGLEKADATAKMDATKIDPATKAAKVDTRGTTATATAKAGTVIKNPMAVAYALNRDPASIEWDSPGNRSLTLDLSEVRLNAQTTGEGSFAAALSHLVGGYIDGTDDVDLPPSDATRFFDLSLGLFSSDGQAPVKLAELSFLDIDDPADPDNLLIRDSAGGQGLATVAADLNSRFQLLADGSFGFASPFSITFGLPGVGSSSVLFLDQYNGAAAQAAAVPEPATFVLFGLGAVSMSAYSWRRRREVKAATAA